MDKAQDLKAKAKDGSFEVDPAPNPHALVMEHSKTLITISAAFVGLAVTFSDKLLGDSPQTPQIVLFICLWLFILGGLYCGIRTTSSLHKFLFWPEPKTQDEAGKKKAADEANEARKTSARHANAGPVCLMLAGIFALFLVLSKIIQGPQPLNADKCAKISLAYLNSFPGAASSNWTLEKMEWNEDKKTFSITLKIPQSTTAFVLTVDAKRGAVLNATRLTIGLANEGGIAIANPPFVITNFVQMPVISNFVQIPVITNIVQFPAISNFIQMPTITNIIQIPPSTNFGTPPKATNIRRWGFGLGFGSEKQN